MRQKRYWLRGGILFVALFLIYIANHLDPAQKFPGEDYFFLLLPLSFLAGSITGLLYGKYKNGNI